jgi:hypothetical protein
MVNCEGALSDHARQVGLNRTPERFAISMRAAGIGSVNLANNHHPIRPSSPAVWSFRQGHVGPSVPQCLQASPELP